MLYTIIGIITVAAAIIIILHVDKKLTSNWVFWVAVVMLILTFVGIPAGLYLATKNL